MKKIALTGLIAISMIALSQQQASAWINSKFGIGMNWAFQSGGNQVLWGVARGGQPPGPEGFNGGQPYGGGQFFGGGQAPFYGNGPMQPNFAPQQNFVPVQQNYAPLPQPQGPAEASYAQPQYSTPYQFANYARPVYYYPAPAYYYYSYGR